MDNPEHQSGKQKAAEADVAAVATHLGPFVVAAETTRMPMVFTNAKAADNPIIFANDSFLTLTGCDREEVLGQSFNFLIARGADPDAVAAIEAAFDTKSITQDPQIRYHRKDGSIFWAEVFISPVLDERGDVVQHFASFRDVSRHKQEEDRLRFLLNELNHRTQNTLATVLGIVMQTLRGVADEGVVKTLEGRIMALAKAQSLLGRTNWHEVTLRDVVDQILEPFGLNDARARHFTVSGGDSKLQPKAALTLAMVLHELATNALKHGSLSTDAGGHIAIAWHVEPTLDGEQMRLRWQETGGPPVTPSRRKGFGSRLIERDLARELDGEVRLDYPPTGAVCEIVMPIAKVAPDGA